MLPAASATNFQAGASFPGPNHLLLSSYAQNRHMEYDIWRNQVPEIPSNNPPTPAAPK